jgi:hypothetical protein
MTASRVEALQPDFRRVQRGALLVGAIGLALSAVGAFVSLDQFFQSYLVAYLFWVEIALGCCAIVMLHHLVGGRWGFLIRRPLEAGAMTLPLMALLFVPLLFGLHVLYVWTHADVVAGDEALRHKSLYLNVPFFVIRTVAYFAIWCGLAALLNRWSLAQDRTAEPGLMPRLRRLSALGLVVYAPTASFAAIDWVMSLEPDWYSTIYGMLIMVGQGLATLAFATVVVVWLSDREPLARVVSPDRYNDLGNLLLTFVILWAYMSFSQFLIIWSGNLPEENSWYLHRSAAGWQWLIVVLALFHFALPFLLLLSHAVKRRGRRLALLAAAIVAVHLVETYWLVAPAFHPAGLHLSWLDFAAPVGVGGVWIAAFVWLLARRPLLPLHDPRMPEVPGYE